MGSSGALTQRGHGDTQESSKSKPVGLRVFWHCTLQQTLNHPGFTALAFSHVAFFFPLAPLPCAKASRAGEVTPYSREQGKQHRS